MSVYTEIEENKISQLCAQFGVSVASVSPVLGGVQNSNWFVTATDKTEYVLTLFEAVSLPEVKSLTSLVKQIHTYELPVATPLPHESGLDYTDYQGKPLQLFLRLPGEHPEYASALMTEDMGQAMATLHDILANVTSSTDINIIEKTIDFEARRDLFLHDLPIADKKIMYKVWQKYTAATLSQDYTNLPNGLIHADLFFDNTLWTNEDLTGVLDFTEVRDDFLLMDIAITANDFCMDWEEMEFDFDKLEYFLKGYGSVRSLSDYEQEVLPVFLAMAAVRFWLFRLNMQRINAENNRGGDNILEKSPDLMRDLAKIHLDRIV